MEKKQYGRVDFKYLQDHYGGEGKKYVRIKESEVLRKKLQQKHKRAIYFEKFLNNMKTIFTGFEDKGKLLTEVQKIVLLLQKVQIPSLYQVKNTLQL